VATLQSLKPILACCQDMASEPISSLWQRNHIKAQMLSLKVINETS